MEHGREGRTGLQIAAGAKGDVAEPCCAPGSLVIERFARVHARRSEARASTTLASAARGQGRA